MLKNCVIICFVICTLLGCKRPFPGYTELDADAFYRIHFIGDGEKKIENGDRVHFRVECKDMNENSLYSSGEDYDISKSTFLIHSAKSKISQVLCLLHEGDSATFLLKRDHVVIDSLSNLKELSKTDLIKVDVKITKVYTPEGYKKEQERKAWLKDREMNEQIDLISYLSSNKIDHRNFYDGMYYTEIRRGRGERAQTGDLIAINYRGYFLDGTLFDDTYASGEPFIFYLGDPEQVIPGFDTGLRRMRAKSKGKFIIPSQVGFGEKGSSTGIVQPFTSLIYEVELISLNDQNLLNN